MKVYIMIVIIAILIIINKCLNFIELPKFLYAISYVVTGTSLFVVIYLKIQRNDE